MMPYSRNGKLTPVSLSGLAALLAVLVFGCASMRSEGLKQAGFDSPEQALTELVSAAGAHDTDRLLAIFGPAEKEIVSSGDQIQDKADREAFVRLYHQKHSLEKESAQKAILLVGPDDHPFPIPIVKQADKWYFDSPAGAEELLNRRIGRNELKVIEVMLAYTDAQREYAAQDRNGDGVFEYAQRIMSREGTRDGLYWEATGDEEQSPFGPMVAVAAQEGHLEKKDADSPPVPYQGYFYKILKSQGAHAPGGAYDYLVNAKMIFGFALVAYPAQYGSSGIMTFTVNQSGTVYEKDLGEETEKQAKALNIFDPDPTWKKAET